MKNFYRQIFQCKNIIKTLRFIDFFIQEKRIKVSLKVDPSLTELRKRPNTMRNNTETMKVSNISKFFKSTTNPKEAEKTMDDIYRNSLRNQTSSIYNASSKIFSPSKWDRSSNFNDSGSQTFVRPRKHSCNKPSTNNPFSERNFSKSPTKKGHNRRFNGSLFIPTRR